MQGIEWLVGALGSLVRDNMSEGPLKGFVGGRHYRRCRRGDCLFAQYLDSIFLHIFDGGFRIYGACRLYHG